VSDRSCVLGTPSRPPSEAGPILAKALRKKTKHTLIWDAAMLGGHLGDRHAVQQGAGSNCPWSLRSSLVCAQVAALCTASPKHHSPNQAAGPRHHMCWAYFPDVAHSEQKNLWTSRLALGHPCALPLRLHVAAALQLSADADRSTLTFSLSLFQALLLHMLRYVKHKGHNAAGSATAVTRPDAPGTSRRHQHHR
jgi:hypothetical protein